MPTYDYFCKKCDITIEVNHSINESPEIHCEKCKKIMVRTISGGIGYIFKKGATRSQTLRQRHGNKKTSLQSTPSESAHAKGVEKIKEIESAKNKSSDPYSEFRS